MPKWSSLYPQNVEQEQKNEKTYWEIMKKCTLLLELMSLQHNLAHNFELDEQRAVARKQISSFYVGADKICRLDRL